METDTPVKAKRQSKKKQAAPTAQELQIKHLLDMLETNRVKAEGWYLIANERAERIQELESEVARLTKIVQLTCDQIEAIRL